MSGLDKNQAPTTYTPYYIYAHQPSAISLRRGYKKLRRNLFFQKTFNFLCHSKLINYLCIKPYINNKLKLKRYE